MFKKNYNKSKKSKLKSSKMKSQGKNSWLNSACRVISL